MLSPFALPSRTALNLLKGLRINSAKHPCICKISQMPRSFVAYGSSG
jgi:hypothetical protein